MKKHVLFIPLLIVLLTSACLFFQGSGEDTSGGGSNTSGGSTGKDKVPAELQYILENPSDPIQVTPSLDTAQQAEAILTSSGGSLTAKGKDGTTFQLEALPGALASDTLIRMTPLSSLADMPFGSASYAVHLEPEGLFFYAPVVLTITPPQEIPLDQQLTFGYQGEQHELFLVPPVVDSQTIQLQILHFSGYGVTKGLLTDIEPVRARIGGAAENRLQSAIAEQLGRARQAQLLGQESPEIDWGGFFQQYEEQVIKPRLAAAGESCAAGRLAIQTVLGYERQRQLLGMGEGSLQSLTGAGGVMDLVAETCMKEEYEMCRDDHIIHRIIPAWLGLERQAQLLGTSGEGSSNPVMEKAKDYVRKCMSFELLFHSQADFDDGEGGGYTSVVDSKIKVQFNPDDLSFKGQAPLVNTDFEFRAPDCSVDNKRGGDTFEAISLAYLPDTKSPTDQLGYVRDFKLIYYPGNTTENFTITCEDSPPYTSPPSPLWTGAFLPLHDGEMSPTEGGFIAENWEILGDEYFAKLEWIKEDGGVGVVEAGTFKLYHRPQ